MDRFIPCYIGFALMILGVCLLIRPAEMAMYSRESDDAAPVSSAEIWRTRVTGALLIAGGAYAIYAVIMRLPGAEFIGV